MKLFIVGGKAKSGKNTFGKFLREELKEYGYKPCVMHITQPLYQYAEEYFEWNKNSDEKPREFLQKVGIDIIKEKLGKRNFLINRTMEDMEILKEFFDTFIIVDARLREEYEVLKKEYKDVVSIKIERENYDYDLTDSEKKHITEVDLDDYTEFDYVVINDGLISMKEQAKKIAKNEEGV